MSACDAVDGSSTGTVSAMDVGAVRGNDADPTRTSVDYLTDCRKPPPCPSTVL